MEVSIIKSTVCNNENEYIGLVQEYLDSGITWNGGNKHILEQPAKMYPIEIQLWSDNMITYSHKPLQSNNYGIY